MRASASPVYYGWFVLVASAISELLVMGATAYAAGLFVLPLQAEFQITRAAANSAVIILYLGAALAAPLVGRMLDRHSIRLVLCIASLVLAASFAVIATSSSLLVMALVLFLPAAAAFTALGPLTTQVLTTRWFNRHRGLALGIAAVATSGGGFVVVPLLSQAIQHYGWRQGLIMEAVLLAVIIIALSLLVLRDRPSDMGLADHPENQPRGGADGQPAATSPVALRWIDIMTSRAFWVPSVALAMISGTCQAVVVTLVPHGVSLGFAPTQAAFLISAFAIAGGITKVLAGVLADHLNQRFLLIAAAFSMTLSWLVLSLSSAYGGLLLSASLAGIALGFALPTAAALIAAAFSAAGFGRVMGWTYTMTLVCAIVSVLFVGIMFDRTASYHAAFQIFAGLLGLLLVLTLLVPPARRSPV